MQFTKIRLSGRTDIDLPFFGLRAYDRYILKAVDGLGPPESSVEAGVRLVQPRQLVIRTGLNPDYGVGETVSSMRRTLYGLLTPGPSQEVMVKLMNGPTIVAQIAGTVSKMEINPFAKDPEVQITIDGYADQPYFEAENPVAIVPSAKTNFQIDNIGDETTGFYFEAIFNANASSFSLFNTAPSTDPRMRFVYAFLDGDKLMIDTRKGQRSIKLLRGTDTSSILGSMTTSSVWFQLHPGVNTFWTSPTTFDWGQIIYTPQYWGI